MRVKLNLIILSLFLCGLSFSARAVDRYSNSQKTEYERDVYQDDSQYKKSKISRYEASKPFKRTGKKSKFNNRYFKSKKFQLTDEKGDAGYEYVEKPRYNDKQDDSIYKKKGRRYAGYYKVGNPYKIFGRWYYPEVDTNYKEVGVSSWYGEDFYGKLTANGETYDMYDMTAAHRTLPMPCIVKVTNLDNGRSLKLRVNDRGPFAKERIIDVSKAAAKKLGFQRQGTTEVKVEYLHGDSKKLWKNLGINP